MGSSGKKISTSKHEYTACFFYTVHSVKKLKSGEMARTMLYTWHNFCNFFTLAMEHFAAGSWHLTTGCFPGVPLLCARAPGYRAGAFPSRRSGKMKAGISPPSSCCSRSGEEVVGRISPARVSTYLPPSGELSPRVLSAYSKPIPRAERFWN